MRTHGRKRRILLHDSDFRGKFRIVQHFSCRNAVFPPIPYPPNRFFRHFSATTGVHGVARFQKTAEKWNRATFRDTERAEAAGSMQPPQEKRIQGRLPPFFPYILMRFIREEPRVPETSPISMKLVMFCWAISTQSSTTQLPSNCSGSDCST